MKKACFVLFSILIASLFGGCSDNNITTAIDNSTPVRTSEQSTSSALFQDDFDSGVDPSVWSCQNINGAEWVYATEGTNGFIRCGGQSPFSMYDRWTDALTVADDMYDLLMTWDMRFQSESWNADYRCVYFRSYVDTWSVGGFVRIAVGKPVPPYGDWVQVERSYPDNTGAVIIPFVPTTFEQNTWYSFKLLAIGTTVKIKVWPKASTEPSEWLGEGTAPDDMSAGSVGFGNYWGATTDADNVTVYSPLFPSMDIKPGSCPNPFNIRVFADRPGAKAHPRMGGVLPVALMGDVGFDVHDVDRTSLSLMGVEPLRSEYEDVGTPAGDGECDCTTAGPDGCDDLILKFPAQLVADALGDPGHGETVVLSLSGTLLDGTPFAASDCIVILSETPDSWE